MLTARLITPHYAKYLQNFRSGCGATLNSLQQFLMGIFLLNQGGNPALDELLLFIMKSSNAQLHYSPPGKLGCTTTPQV